MIKCSRSTLALFLNQLADGFLSCILVMLCIHWTVRTRCNSNRWNVVVKKIKLRRNWGLFRCFSVIFVLIFNGTPFLSLSHRNGSVLYSILLALITQVCVETPHSKTFVVKNKEISLTFILYFDAKIYSICLFRAKKTAREWPGTKVILA